MCFPYLLGELRGRERHAAILQEWLKSTGIPNSICQFVSILRYQFWRRESCLPSCVSRSLMVKIFAATGTLGRLQAIRVSSQNPAHSWPSGEPRGLLITRLEVFVESCSCPCGLIRPDVICLSSGLSAAGESSEWATTLATGHRKILEL